MEKDTSSQIKFSELNEYFYNNNVFGFTATRRKKVIIYSFTRYYNSLGPRLCLKVKVDRHTKNVISVMSNGITYSNFEDIKKLVEK